MKSSTQKYYLVSDLHMGGDGALQHCDYSAEFIEFLKELEKEGPDTELLIVGDTFGFWELTLVRVSKNLITLSRRTKLFSINSAPPANVSRSP
jgi:UDP-2,3-diacylglucosamine pyrophosphatase LpxH